MRKKIFTANYKKLFQWNQGKLCKLIGKFWRKLMGIENIPSPFLISTSSFRNRSVFACSAEYSSVARRREGVNTELFCI